MRTIIVGFDSFDPSVFEALQQAGRMPNLSKFVEQGGYSRLEVCSPPQTEVSWTSIATGVDPGSHGIFDFVHRDPQTYIPYVSILPTKQSVMGEQFLHPYNTKTLFQEAADMGYPATALWWPALFPARPEIPVATIPGLGTPDIRGQLGVGTYLTTQPREMKKVKVTALEAAGANKFTAALEGPTVKTKEGMRPALLPVTVEVLDDTSASLTIGKEKYKLSLGVWSPVIEVKFAAGFAMTIHAVTQVILTQVKDGVSLYFVPLQIHPLHSLWHYATPASLVKESWNVTGGFLTLGWPQDTNGLEEGCISDQQFLDLCDLIFDLAQEDLLPPAEQVPRGRAGRHLRLPRPRAAYVHAHEPGDRRAVVSEAGCVRGGGPVRHRQARPREISLPGALRPWLPALRSEGASQSLADRQRVYEARARDRYA